MTSSRTKLFLWLALLGVLAIEGSLFLRFRDSILEGKADFTSFYAAAQALHLGQGERLYEVETQREFQRDFAARRTPLLFYHPPFELLWFWPLARLPFPQAYLVWVTLNAMLLVFLASRLLPGAESGAGGLARVTACFAFAPAFIALLQGQDSILLLLLFTLAYRDLRRRNDGRAGCYLALALFKFQFVLPFVAILLMRRRWRLLPGFAATSTGLLLVSFFLVGWEGLAGYVAFFREISMKLAYGTIHPQLMPNLRGAVATLLPDPVPAAVTFSVVVILSGLLLILAAWRWPSTESSEEARFDLAFALGVVATVLASYHLNAHDLALLLLPVALVARHLAQTRGQSGWARRGLLLAVFSLYYPALYFVPEDSTLPHSLVWVLLLFVVSLESELGKTRAPASA